MKYLYIVIFSFVFFQVAKTQNLVSNGNFELYTNCTGGLTGGNVTTWTVSSTPDFYDTCNATVPYASGGYQKDCCGGGGYIGQYFLYLWDKVSIPSSVEDKEYIHTTLTDTLKLGHKYLSSMFISNVEANGYAIATASMLFTDTTTTQPGLYVFIHANPQVKNTSLITDTLNWTLVQGTFVATGNEVYLTIGNFNTTATSDSVVLQSTYGGGFNAWPAAYYYIDGVSVYDVTGGACNNLWDAGYDKYIFAGDSIRLGAINTDSSSFIWTNSIGGNTYLSSNLDARPWSKPTVTTTYYVTKTCPNNNVYKDTVTVFVQQQPMKINQFSGSRAQATIFPNPTSDQFYIEANTSDKLIVDLYDVNGRRVFSTNVNDKSNINVTTLDEGVYSLTIKTADRLINKKLVILR